MKLFRLEIFGIFFTISASVFFQNLYFLSDRSLIGVMFGSVNDSIWETAKTLLLPFLIWGAIEALSIDMPFHRFVVSKIISLYWLAGTYILLCLVFNYLSASAEYMAGFISGVASVCTAAYLSYRLTYSDIKLEGLFIPCCFMLLLLCSFFFSFTPFPPKLYIFMDRSTGLYGIIPEHIDTGAIALDSIYYL